MKRTALTDDGVGIEYKVYKDRRWCRARSASAGRACTTTSESVAGLVEGRWNYLRFLRSHYDKKLSAGLQEPAQ